MIQPNDGQIYDFCLDWQMEHVSKKELCGLFYNNSWDYNYFKAIAKKYKWFVNSMTILEIAGEFC
jgi:hypothetical protein